MEDFCRALFLFTEEKAQTVVLSCFHRTSASSLGLTFAELL